MPTEEDECFLANFFDVGVGILEELFGAALEEEGEGAETSEVLEEVFCCFFL